MEKQFKTATLIFCFIFMGMMLGYGWRMYHETLPIGKIVYVRYCPQDATFIPSGTKYSLKMITKKRR